VHYAEIKSSPLYPDSMAKTLPARHGEAAVLNQAWALVRAARAPEALKAVAQWRRTHRNVSAELLKVEATALQQTGQHAKALLAIESLEKIAAPDADVLSVKAVSLRGVKRAEEAVEVLEESLKRNDAHGESWHNLAILYSDMGDWDRARPCAARALELLPRHPSAIKSLGRVCINRRDAQGAREMFQRLYDLGHKDAETLQGLGAAELIENDWPRAGAYLEEAMRLDPSLPSTHANLAIVRKNLGDWPGAEVLLRSAVELDGENIEHRWNLALCLLGLGKFSEGWDAYESRYDPSRVVRDRVKAPPIAVPMLRRGDEVAGKVVAIVAEQGFGDSLQFCRFARELKRRGATVVMMMPEPLHVVMRTLPWVDHLCVKWSAAPKLDHWSFVMSLPHVLAVPADCFGGYAPYLFANQGRVQRWAPRFEPHQRELRVGLVWAGRATHSNDANRSMSLASLDALAGIPGVKFYSLQKGDAPADLAGSALGMDPVGDEVGDFADTAAILGQLDLLISVDSAPVHLAGAMGVPAWVLVPQTPDFRWRLEGEHTDWYEDVTLFRQASARDWAPVLQRVRAALSELAASHASALAIRSHRWVLPDIPTDGLEAGQHAVLRQALQLHLAGSPLAPQCYRWVLQFDPNNLDARRNLAAWYRGAGDLAQAQRVYEDTLPLAKGDPIFLGNYANLLLDTRDYDRAAQVARSALDIDPKNTAANYVLATCLTRGGDQAQAEPLLEIALQANPQRAEFLTLRGMHLLKSKAYAQADECFKHLLRLHPRHAEAYVGLARIAMEQDRLEEALVYQDQAIALKPAIPESHLNRGVILSWLGRLDEAVLSVQECIRLSPEDAEAHFYLGMFYLAMGDLRRGSAQYQWRYHPQRIASGGMELPRLSKPQWQGEPLAGKVILIFPEQGYGDYIQFIRYARDLKVMGATVWAAVKPPLHTLMRTCPHLDRLLAEGEQAAGYDYWVFPLSFPHLMGTEVQTIPQGVPYLGADPERVQQWAPRMRAVRGGARLLVGIIWSGSTEHSGDRWRSMDPAHFAPLAALPGVQLVAMDKGAASAARVTLGGREVPNLGPDIHDFADSAAVLTHLDLLVTVDSAPAHLAGALGLPVWVLVAVTHDWRWFTGRQDSPWYPTMRLFRQAKRNDWVEVTGRVAEAVGAITQQP